MATAAHPAAGTSTSEAGAQPSGSGTCPPGAEAYPSKEDEMTSRRNKPSSKDDAHSSPPSTLNTPSQAESLPDLMETEEEKLRKRQRSPSSSPPIQNKCVSLHNRYEVLSLTEDSETQTKKESKKGKGKGKMLESKPNLSRPVISKSSLDTNQQRKSIEKARSQGALKK